MFTDLRGKEEERGKHNEEHKYILAPHPVQISVLSGI
jgi:hypothetical protein